MITRNRTISILFAFAVLCRMRLDESHPANTHGEPGARPPQ